MIIDVDISRPVDQFRVIKKKNSINFRDIRVKELRWTNRFFEVFFFLFCVIIECASWWNNIDNDERKLNFTNNFYFFLLTLHPEHVEQSITCPVTNGTSNPNISESIRLSLGHVGFFWILSTSTSDNAPWRLLLEKPCSFRAIPKRFLSVTGQGQGMRHVYMDVIKYYEFSLVECSEKLNLWKYKQTLSSCGNFFRLSLLYFVI